MEAIIDFIKSNPARIVGFASALFVLLSAYGLFITDDQKAAVLGILSAVLVLIGGESAQRVEDKKTDEALWTTPPEIEIDDYEG